MDRLPSVLGIAKWEFSIPSAQAIGSSSCGVDGIHPTASRCASIVIFGNYEELGAM